MRGTCQARRVDLWKAKRCIDTYIALMCRETRRAFRLATKQQEVLDKKRQVVEKSISEATRVARKTGDEKKQKSAAIRQRKLDERWGLEVNAKGHRFKVRRSEWSSSQ